jgi:hypothetical protein
MLRNHVVHDHIHIHDISFGSTWLQLSEEKLFKLCQAPPSPLRSGVSSGARPPPGSRVKGPAAQRPRPRRTADRPPPAGRGRATHGATIPIVPPRLASGRRAVESPLCRVRLPCRCAPTKRSYPTPLHAHAKHTVSARPTRPTSHLIEESACTTGLERKQKALRHRAASFARHLVRRPWHEWHVWLRSHVNVLSDSQRPP